MGYLDEFPLLLIFVTSLIIILLASEIGRRLGVRARGRGEERVATLEGAMFGLLALMLGFTFAMALSRFEERRHAVLDEANAISTTGLRARLLPAPYNTEQLKLLREYAQLRITISQHIPTSTELRAGVARSNELQEQLWQNALIGAPKADISVPAWLVFESLNQMFNAQRKRLAVLGNQVPNEVLLALYGITILAIAFAGYAQGLRKQPLRIPVYLMGVLACAVIILIEDIETPYTGFISVSQQPLIDAAASVATGY
jgi:hypothetical protein